MRPRNNPATLRPIPTLAARLRLLSSLALDGIADCCPWTDGSVGWAVGFEELVEDVRLVDEVEGTVEAEEEESSEDMTDEVAREAVVDAKGQFAMPLALPSIIW